MKFLENLFTIAKATRKHPLGDEANDRDEVCTPLPSVPKATMLRFMQAYPGLQAGAQRPARRFDYTLGKDKLKFKRGSRLNNRGPDSH